MANHTWPCRACSGLDEHAPWCVALRDAWDTRHGRPRGDDGRVTEAANDPALDFTARASQILRYTLIGVLGLAIAVAGLTVAQCRAGERARGLEKRVRLMERAARPATTTPTAERAR